MKKIMKIVSIMMISFLVLNISFLKVNAEENNKVIVIDPGHGGIDGGAKSENGVIEKDINLSISLKTKAALESKGYKVIMTRSEDVDYILRAKRLEKRK